MIFGEALYFVFLAVAVLVFHALPRAVKPWWLFACGLALYAYYSPAFAWLLLAETGVVFALSRGCCRRDALGRSAFGLGLVVTLGLLGAFKYGALLDRTLHAAVDRAAALLPHVDWLPRATALPSFPRLYLPLAISFFTFEFVHYVVDARKGSLPEHRLRDFLAFAMFFPTMIAGPIKRFQHFQPQLAETHLTADGLAVGVQRIVVGVAKKTLVADTAALWTTPLLSTSAMRAATRQELVVALLAFALKIYFDFSGYSDIAIGSARLFGVRVPENFSWPYLRTSIASFWRHWHMSLTSWITDYVYIPLGGNRLGLPRTLGNLVIAMAVSGLWHGAAWHFAAWGLYHGVLLAGHRAWRHFVAEPLLRLAPEPAAAQPATALGITAFPSAGAAVWGLGRLVAAVAGWALTFAAVTVGWGLFVMPLGRFVEMLGRLL